jgi:hypothetical protein
VGGEMIDLTKLDQIKGLQQNMRQVFENPTGQEVMKFLEQVSGWYDFNETDREKILVAHGRRQVLATIKSLLDHPAEHIQQLAKQGG